MKKACLILPILNLFVAVLFAQNTTNPKLKLFIDCGLVHCDFNFLRQQIPVADFVRDRKLSDLHILLVKQPAGNGGEMFDVIFLGKGRFALNDDTLHFVSMPNSSEDQLRKQLIKTIQAGLVPYFIRAGLLSKMEITYVTDTVNKEAINSKDKWNNWVFSIGGRGNFSGDNNYKESDIGLNSSATRVTDESKLQFYFFKSTNRNTYKVDDNGTSTELKTTNAYTELEQEYVKSISQKWSWAVGSAFRKSTYDNLKNAYSGSAGIEYNIFPYKASNTKFLVLRYELELTRREYLEETIYQKNEETLFSNTLEVNAYFTQPWGSVSGNVGWNNYLHDASKNNMYFRANVQLQLFRGISINFFGSGSRINDQLNLSNAGATPEEVLLKLKALSRNFNYYTGVGINYKFGSRFNNYVNPRFTNGRY